MNMVKWADYCISRIRYNASRTHIDGLRVHVDDGETIGSYNDWPRNQVVNAINQGKSFVTITFKDGQWYNGADVHVVPVNGVKYLRTDKNSIASDNLGNLPEF